MENLHPNRAYFVLFIYYLFSPLPVLFSFYLAIVYFLTVQLKISVWKWKSKFCFKREIKKAFFVNERMFICCINALITLIEFAFILDFYFLYKSAEIYFWKMSLLKWAFMFFKILKLSFVVYNIIIIIFKKITILLKWISAFKSIVTIIMFAF